MPGAGSGTLAFATESSYLGGVGGTPTYYAFGENESVADLEITNNLTRIFDPGSPETRTSVAENFEGAWEVEFIPKNNDWLRLLYNNANSDGFTSGTAPSFELYAGVDYRGGTTERQAKGCIVTRCDVSWTQGEETRVTLSGVYGDESTNTSITPGTISDAGTVATFHTASWTVDTVTIDELQSASISIEPVYRLIRGVDRTPADAVNEQPTPTLEVEAVYDGPKNLELVFGADGATSPQDTVADVSGSVEWLDSGGSTIFDFTYDVMTPASTNWNNLVNPEETLTDPTSFHIHGLTSTAP